MYSARHSWLRNGCEKLDRFQDRVVVEENEVLELREEDEIYQNGGSRRL